MKFLFPLLLLSSIILSSVFSSCTISQSSLKENLSSTCNDSLYLALQKKDSTSFTKSESAYFHKFKEKCIKETNQAELNDGRDTLIIVLGVAAVIVGGLAWLGGSVGGP